MKAIIKNYFNLKLFNNNKYKILKIQQIKFNLDNFY
jgi:hypothetical protein